MLRRYNETLYRLHWLRRGVEYAATLPKYGHYSPDSERYEYVHKQGAWGVQAPCGTYACRLGWALLLEGLWDPAREPFVKNSSVFREIFSAKDGVFRYFGLTPAETIAIIHGDARDDAAALAAVDAAIARHEQALMETSA